MARQPLGQGLEDDGGRSYNNAPPDSDDDDLQSSGGRGQRPVNGVTVHNDDRTSDSPDATVILRETEADRKARDVVEDVVVLDGDQRGDDRLDRGQRDDDDPRSHRRDERRYNKDRRRQARDRDQQHIRRLEAQLAELQQTVQGQSSHSVRQDVSAIDMRIGEMRRALNDANARHARAISASDGDEAIAALAIRDEAVARLSNLTALRAQAERATRTPEAPQIDPRTASMARDWMNDNRWYDPDGGDEDSAIMLAIDQQIARDGFRPNTQEFWDELTERGRKRLPHRFEGDDGMDDERDDRRDDRRPARREAREERRPVNGRRGPPVGGGGGDGGSRSERNGNGTKRYYISPAEKEAWTDAGIIDDPKRLRAALKLRDEFDVRERERTANRGR